MYSSSTILVFTMGNGVNGFTLDPQIGEFVMTHPDIQVPKRGKVREVLDLRRGVCAGETKMNSKRLKRIYHALARLSQMLGPTTARVDDRR